MFVRKLAAGRIRLKNGAKATQATDAEQANRSSRSHTSPETITYDTFRSFEDRPAEVRANIIICLIHQTNYLLDQQIRKLEQDFLKEGGLRERMTRARIESRKRK